MSGQSAAGPARTGGGVRRVDDRERWARAAWSALAEPGDLVAGALLAELGAVEAWAWLQESLRGTAAPLESRAGEAPARLARAVERWRPRAERLAAHGWSDDAPPPGPAGRTRVLVPGDGDWPVGLDDLGAAAPPCLWVRGEVGPGLEPGTSRPRSVALVGARAATAYGERVAVDLASGLVGSGFTIVSGGAYGVDAAAHRGALASGGRTFVVLAGGVDRAYPAGNARLVQDAVASGGAVLAEVPPGSLPTRSRFLQRNRLIAALGAATVVVEAAWRSGALSTANHAARLGRPVGAVPGPVTSMASAGCHRLLREGAATCVTDAAEVAELAGDLGADLAPEPEAQPRAHDGLDPTERRVHDALGTRSVRSVASVARASGVTVAEALAALGTLELAGLARYDRSGWRAGV